METVSEEFRHGKLEKVLEDGSAAVKSRGMAIVDADSARTRARKWRYKVQKALLSNTTLKEEDVPAVDALFKDIEAYDQMTLDALAVSKIGKVMRHVAALTDEKVPLDNVFHFRQRATALVRQWHGIISGTTFKKEVSPVAATQVGDTREQKAQTAIGGAVPTNMIPTSDDLDQDPELSKVRQWRFEVQNALLGETIPRDEDLPALDALFKTIENYTGMTLRHLAYSKLAKVMRFVALLSEDRVPRESEYKFRDRAQALIDKWIILVNVERASLPEATQPESILGGKIPPTEYPPPPSHKPDTAMVQDDSAAEARTSDLGEMGSLSENEEWILVDALDDMQLS